MKVGDVIARDHCLNCNRPIEQTWWGNGGTQWTHANERDECSPPAYATPGGNVEDNEEKAGGAVAYALAGIICLESTTCNQCLLIASEIIQAGWRSPDAPDEEPQPDCNGTCGHPTCERS